MNYAKEIIETCTFVAKNSQNIKIDYDKINEFVNYFNHSYIKHWIDESPFNLKKLNPRDRLHFLLVFNSISFSYWGDPKWKIIYHSEEVDGAYGMISAIARAIENKIPILDARFLSEMDEKVFSNILEGNIQIPLFEERLNILRDVGTTLLKKFDGEFTNVLKKANGDSRKLLGLIVENFPSFEDSSIYNGRRVYFYKRAQLLVADIFQAFKKHEFGKLTNVDKLTACADYKLPFVLRRLGIFSYSNYLADKIDNQIQIDKDSEEELELRSNTIFVVEMIKQKLKNKIKKVDSIHVNDHIWFLGQNKLKNDKPYHLTRTTSY
ncbi:MAG: queuosine salvage family protein [Nanoarchaeota archaeon]|nr:queuosine salvage family protein [Nanoarchaeota archaeon]